MTAQAQREAQQLSPWGAAMMRALDKSAPEIGYEHARFTFVRELLRLGEAHFKAANPERHHPRRDYPREALISALGLRRTQRNDMEKFSAAAWEMVSPEMRTAARHLAEELIPEMLEHGLYRTIGKFDNFVAEAAYRTFGSNMRAAPALRLEGGETVQKLRMRRSPGRLDRPTIPPELLSSLEARP